jgi:adenylate cyclase
VPLEIELKLALPDAAQRAFLRHPIVRTAGSAPARKLHNVYFDTSDLELYRHGIAVRLRRQGRQWLQTVKCEGVAAGGLSTRPEWEQPYAGEQFDFSSIDDSAVRKRLERAQRRGRLAPVFETAFFRRTWRVPSSNDAVLTLVLDRGTIEARDRREPVSEVEIEIDGTATDFLFDTALSLATDLPLKPEPLSKAQRGYALYRGDGPVPAFAKASCLDKNLSPAQAFRAVALQCTAHLQGNERGALISDAPEFIHQMRVALRRLRSAMRLFRPILPPSFAPAITPPLKRLAGALGAARDWDVVIDELLAPVRTAFPEDERLVKLCDAAERQRHSAREEARRALQAPEYGRLMLELLAALHGAAFDGADAPQTLRRFASRRLRKLHRRTAALARDALGLEVDALHALRVGVKRLRYAMEFFAPLYRRATARQEIAALAKLQTRLGRFNDLANARRLLSECAGENAEAREALALVAGWYGPRVEALFSELPERISALVRVEAGKRRG